MKRGGMKRMGVKRGDEEWRAKKGG